MKAIVTTAGGATLRHYRCLLQLYWRIVKGSAGRHRASMDFGCLDSQNRTAHCLSHKSVEDAAHAVGLDPNTLLRWLQVPEFQNEYRKARREAVHQFVARMQQATGAAAITVLKLMTDQNVPPAVRLRAAECVFDHAIKGVELDDIEARLSELERAADASNQMKKTY